MLQGSVHYLLGQLKGHAIYAWIQPLYHKGLIDGVLQRWFYMNYESSVLLLTFSASAFSFSFFFKTYIFLDPCFSSFPQHGTAHHGLKHSNSNFFFPGCRCCRECMCSSLYQTLVFFFSSLTPRALFVYLKSTVSYI